MTLYDVACRAYSIHLHFKPNDNYNAIRNEFELSDYLKNGKPLQTYIQHNKHELMKYTIYSKRDVTFFLVLNQWLCNCQYNIIEPPDSSVIDKFTSQVVYYQDLLSNDLRHLYDVCSYITSQELWSFYTKKEISWFSLFYIFKYLGTDKEWFEDITIKPRVEKIGLMVQFFGFNEESIKDIISESDLKKKLEITK